ncbi:MAG: PqqD family protein [Candidatus Izemoplasmatales bacterium]|jgi:hypothetical protein|nr:PqqD family protein [Candidatus Izemoplasmatales bacterium]MDD3865937.1 PqqD family protein [Candidatus Izemoplasmatales bacterium]
MKIKEGYVLRTVAGEHIVVPIGNEAVNFNGILTLNNSGKLLWEALIAGSDIKGLTTKLMEIFVVEETVAYHDVLAFISKLRTHNILIEND